MFHGGGVVQVLWMCSDVTVLTDLRALRLLRFPTDDASRPHPPKVLALSERACPRVSSELN